MTLIEVVLILVAVIVGWLVIAASLEQRMIRWLEGKPEPKPKSKPKAKLGRW